jgi:hypothetical protein
LQGVVEVAAGGGGAAAGALAGAVAGGDVVALGLGGFVGVGGQVDQVPGGVGEQPPPGAVGGDAAGGVGGEGAGAGQLGGFVVEAEQGAGGDHDVDLGGAAVVAGQVVVAQGVLGEVGEHVGAALVKGPHVPDVSRCPGPVAVAGAGALGEPGDPLVGGLDLPGGRDPFQAGLAVVEGFAPHAAPGGGGGAAGLGGGVGGDHGAAQRGAEHGGGLAPGAAQDAGLHGVGGGRVEGVGGLGDGAGLDGVDAPGGERGAGAGEPGQGRGELDAQAGGGRGQGEPGGELGGGDLGGGDLLGAGADPAQTGAAPGELGGSGGLGGLGPGLDPFGGRDVGDQPGVGEGGGVEHLQQRGQPRPGRGGRQRVRPHAGVRRDQLGRAQRGGGRVGAAGQHRGVHHVGGHPLVEHDGGHRGVEGVERLVGQVDRQLPGHRVRRQVVGVRLGGQVVDGAGHPPHLPCISNVCSNLSRVVRQSEELSTTETRCRATGPRGAAAIPTGVQRRCQPVRSVSDR